jgi:small subunit ribosomal protein S5
MKLKDKILRKRIAPESCGQLTDKTVFINRVAKVVKGGRRFSFSALVVSGDGMGHVGFGMGKSAEVPEAIRKASEMARKNLVTVPIRGTTIPHDAIASFAAAKLVMKPAAPGTGVIAGSVVRSVLDAAGIKDIRTKSLGSTSPNVLLQACFNGLLSLRQPEDVVALTGHDLEARGYKAF